MTDEQMRDLVKECGLDWQRGYMPLFDDDPTNRYAVLIGAVEAAVLRKLAEQDPCAWRHSKTGRLSDMEGGLSLADGDEWAEPLYAAPMPKE